MSILLNEFAKTKVGSTVLALQETPNRIRMTKQEKAGFFLLGVNVSSLNWDQADKTFQEKANLSDIATEQDVMSELWKSGGLLGEEVKSGSAKFFRDCLPSGQKKPEEGSRVEYSRPSDSLIWAWHIEELLLRVAEEMPREKGESSTEFLARMKKEFPRQENETPEGWRKRVAHHTPFPAENLKDWALRVAQNVKPIKASSVLTRDEAKTYLKFGRLADNLRAFQ